MLTGVRFLIMTEQNSLDLCWQLLMSPEYSGFRNCLFGDETDFARFRQVCVQVVLATDIFDRYVWGTRKVNGVISV